MAKLRRWLTEILMEVTGGEIEKVVQQIHKAKLRKGITVEFYLRISEKSFFNRY